MNHVSAAQSYRTLYSHRVDRLEAIATMPLWGLPSRPAAARTELLKRGFAERRKDHFVMGRLWAGIQDGKVYVGIDGQRVGQELGPHLLKKQPSSGAHRTTAIAKTGSLTGKEPRISVSLKALDFKDKGGGLYQHKDGSWVFVRDGKMTRGYSDVTLTDVPKPLGRGEHPTYDKVPSDTWDWFKRNTALGRTPRITADQAPRTLRRLGYAPPKAGENKWVHKDGSWFRVASYSLTPGFQKWRLGQLPFNNRRAS